MRELARLIDVLPQELSNWEYGKRIPKPEQVALLMGVLVVGPEERARLLDLARTAREPSWLEKAVPGVASGGATYAEHEREATEMFDWEPVVIPGLFQTPAYCHALLSARKMAPRGIEKVVLARLARRQVLTRERPSVYHVLVGERALRSGVGGEQVMVEQLQHLQQASMRRSVRLQVLPDRAGAHAGLFNNFSLLDFAALPPIVFIELFRASAYLYEDDQVADYRTAAKTLAGLALSEQDSCAFIGEMIAQRGGADG